MSGIAEFLDIHEKVALQFSCGKDSAACLWLLEPWWDQIEVVWVNSGNAYPETIDYMDRIRQMVPNFTELHGYQPQWVRQHGHPVDVLPMSMSVFQSCMGDRRTLLVQPFSQCCSANLWTPMQNWIIGNQVTGVIRGQKTCDPLHNGVKHLQWVEGVQYYFPVESWSDERVIDYLGDRIPDSYKRGIKTSLDCLNCTAYVAENQERFADLEKLYPSIAAEVRTVHAAVKQELIDHISYLG